LHASLLIPAPLSRPLKKKKYGERGGKKPDPPGYGDMGALMH